MLLSRPRVLLEDGDTAQVFGSAEVASDTPVAMRVKLYKGKCHRLRNVEKTQGETSLTHGVGKVSADG